MCQLHLVAGFPRREQSINKSYIRIQLFSNTVECWKQFIVYYIHLIDFSSIFSLGFALATFMTHSLQTLFTILSSVIYSIFLAHSVSTPDSTAIYPRSNLMLIYHFVQHPPLFLHPPFRHVITKACTFALIDVSPAAFRFHIHIHIRVGMTLGTPSFADLFTSLPKNYLFSLGSDLFGSCIDSVLDEVTTKWRMSINW